MIILSPCDPKCQSSMVWMWQPWWF
jgi:hypothetical protein